MSEYITQVPLEQNVKQNSPGLMLAEARQIKGWPLAGVAEQLNLTETTVRALERDDFEQIKHFAFIRGYLRAYARLLGLSPDTVVECFNALKLQEPAVQIQSIGTQSINSSYRNIFVKWVSFILVVVMLSLVTLWWQSQHRPELKTQHALLLNTKNKSSITEMIPDNISADGFVKLNDAVKS